MAFQPGIILVVKECRNKHDNENNNSNSNCIDGDDGDDGDDVESEMSIIRNRERKITRLLLMSVIYEIVIKTKTIIKTAKHQPY